MIKKGKKGKKKKIKGGGGKIGKIIYHETKKRRGHKQVLGGKGDQRRKGPA